MEIHHRQYKALAVGKSQAVHVNHVFVALAGVRLWTFMGKAVELTGRLLGVGPAAVERYLGQHTDTGGAVVDPARGGCPPWKLPVRLAVALIRSYLQYQRSNRFQLAPIWCPRCSSLLKSEWSWSWSILPSDSS